MIGYTLPEIRRLLVSRAQAEKRGSAPATPA